MKHFVHMSSYVLLSVIMSLLPARAQEMEWHTLYDANGVTFSYQIVTCSGPEFIVCQVINTNAQAVAIIFQLRGKEGAPLPLAERRPLVVEAGQTLTGSCEAPIPGLYMPRISDAKETLNLEITTHVMHPN